MKRTFMDDLDDFVFAVVTVFGGIISIAVVGVVLGLISPFMLPSLIRKKFKQS